MVCDFQLNALNTPHIVTKDTFGNPILTNPSGSNESQIPYNFSASGIAWPGEAKKYTSNPVGPSGYSDYSEITPPPNWALQYPSGYTAENPPPNLKTDERFQNWMCTAGLPTFTKLYGRNNADTMQKGRYRIIIGLSKFITPNTDTAFNCRLTCCQTFQFFLIVVPSLLLYLLFPGLVERILS